MRKADYTLLAALIKHRIDTAKWQGLGMVEAHLCTLAHDFARQSGVNKAEFLKACGIG